MYASHPFFYCSAVLLIVLLVHFSFAPTHGHVAVAPATENHRSYLDLSTFFPSLKQKAMNYIRSDMSFDNGAVDRSTSLGDDELLNENYFQPFLARQIEASPGPMQTSAPLPTPTGSPSAIPSVAIPTSATSKQCECNKLGINKPWKQVAWKYVGEPHKLTYMHVSIHLLSFSKTIKTSYVVRSPRRMVQMYARVDFAPANRTTMDLRGDDYRFWQNKRRVNFYDSYDLAWFCGKNKYPITISAHVRIGAPADSFGNIPKNGQIRQFVDHDFNFQANLICSSW